MTSELFKEWHTWATDRLAQPRSPAAAHSYEYWLELKVGRLASDKSALEQRVEELQTFLWYVEKEADSDGNDGLVLFEAVPFWDAWNKGFAAEEEA